MNRKRTFLLTTCALLATLAQGQAIHFPLDGTTAELVTGRTFALEGVRTLPYMPGVQGQALRLDGYSNYLRAPLDYATLSPTGLCLSLWCAAETYPMMNAAEAEDIPSYAILAGNLDETARTGFALLLSSQGQYQFKCFLNGWPLTCNATDLLPTGQWQHLCVTIDQANNQISLYRNGRQTATARCPYALSLGTAPFYIGKSPTTLTSGPFHLNTFSGLVDEVKVENQVPTAAQVAATYTTLSASLPQPTLAVPAEAWADDPLRPRFHGMPSHAWTNESHGLTFSDGRYHLFFQKNANGPYMARLHWGHITSADLLQWEEAPIALAPGERYDRKGCWSGCLVEDSQITAGQPHILYTAVDNARATIARATPRDESLLAWDKAEGNPILNGRPPGLSDDFRDPYFFRTEHGAFLIVGSSKNGLGTCTLHRYDPATQGWSNDGTLFHTATSAATEGTFWEMPTLTPMGEGLYLFTVTPLNTAHGVRTLYYTGRIDRNGQFQPTSAQAQTVELAGLAREGYGLLSPTVWQSPQGQTLALGIVPDKLPSQANYEMGYAHTFSLPREWSLAADGTLLQRPYSGLRALRSQAGQASGRQVEVFVDFTVGTGLVGTHLLKKGDRSARVYYNPLQNTLTADFTTLERRVNDAGTFNGLYTTTLPRTLRPGERVTLNVFLDGSVLDLFVNDQWATSIHVFATDAEATGVELMAANPSDVQAYHTWNLTPSPAASIASPTAAGPAPQGAYSLGGQRLPASRCGLHIVNGRKVLTP